MISRRRLAPLLLVLSVLSASRALAAEAEDKDKEAAAKSFAEGEAAFARREFAAAALAFERAARLVPHPSPWLNAAEAWERAGDLVRASEDCDRTLAFPNLEPAFASEARARLARLERNLGRIAVEGDATYHVRIDEGPMLEAPVTTRVEPGRHRVVWSWSGNLSPTDKELWLDIGRGEAKTLPLPQLLEQGERSQAAQPPLPEASPQDALAGTRPPLLGVPTAAWIAFGLGASAGIVGATFGGLTLSAKSAFNDAPSNAHADTFFARRRVTNIALVAAGVSATAGVLLWVFDVGAEEPHPVGVALEAGPSGAGLSARLRY